MSHAFRIVRADWQRDLAALRAVRETVFVEEQHVPIELEWDDLDEACDHVLALDRDGRPVGTGRLTPERHVGRMAVLPAWRGRGVGAAMLASLLQRARERRWPQVSLHAQVTAIDFYRRFGFACVGEEFVEAGIRHRLMSLDLSTASVDQTCRSWDESREAVLQLLLQARYAACAYSRDLLPAALDNDAAWQAMRRLASSGPRASLRFLLKDVRQVQQRGHRLLALFQLLPSHVEIRVVVEPEDKSRTDAFVVNDRGGFLQFPDDGRAESHGHAAARLRSAPLQAWFNAAWERAVPASDLRKLDI